MTKGGDMETRLSGIDDNDNVVITIRCKGWFKKQVMAYCQNPDVERSVSWLCKKAISKMIGCEHLIADTPEEDKDV
jgi:hypothetical protein